VTRGLAFYTDHGQPTLLLTAALYSLRKYYGGPVHIIYGPHTPEWFVAILKGHGKISLAPATEIYTGSSVRDSLQKFLLAAGLGTRLRAHKIIPFDTRVMYDCDHIFVRPLDAGVFDMVEQHGMASFGLSLEQLGEFNRTKTMKVAEDIRALGLPCAPQLQPGYASCLGTTASNSALIDEVLHYLEIFDKSGSGRLHSKFADQHALAYTMQRHGIPIGSDRWSYSGQSALMFDLKSRAGVRRLPEGAMAIHFAHGRYKKNQSDHIFAHALGDAIQANFLELNTEWLRYAEAHPDVRKYGARLAKEYAPHSKLFTELMQRLKSNAVVQQNTSPVGQTGTKTLTTNDPPVASPDVLSVKWAVGFKDRGLGHGDYSAITEGGALVVECPDRAVAEHVVKIHNQQLEVHDER